MDAVFTYNAKGKTRLRVNKHEKKNGAASNLSEMIESFESLKYLSQTLEVREKGNFQLHMMNMLIAVDTTLIMCMLFDCSVLYVYV